MADKKYGDWLYIINLFVVGPLLLGLTKKLAAHVKAEKSESGNN